MQKPVQPTVLIVDDDLRLRALLETVLGREGFEVLVAGNGRQMDKRLSENQVELVVLDLMLPDRSGLEICRDLRAAGNKVPVLMLTAKGDDVDRIVGLEIGADDYLTKPCNPRELVARIRAILRRQLSTPPGAPPRDGQTFRFGACELHSAQRVLVKAGKPVDLTTGEFAVLLALVSHPGETLSRDRLTVLARGRTPSQSERAIDIAISRLRRLIEDDPTRPRYLQTVWGAGYVFVADAAR